MAKKILDNTLGMEVLNMRFILSFVLISAFAILIACETAASSTIETKKVAKTNREKTADTKNTDSKKEELAKRSIGSHDADGGHRDNVKRVSLEDAKKAFDTGEALFIDTRSKNSYLNEHIEGAINIPFADFENRYKEVPKDKKIIVYCS